MADRLTLSGRVKVAVVAVAVAVVRGAGAVVGVGPAVSRSRSRAESVVCWLLLLSLLAGVRGRDGGCRGRGEWKMKGSGR